MKVILLILDPQIDFHPAYKHKTLGHPRGALAIPGANQDCERVVQMIKTHGSKISEVIVTQDARHVSNSAFYGHRCCVVEHDEVPFNRS
jgi:hypothetical protein